MLIDNIIDVLYDLSNYNEIFRKHVSHDIIKSQKKPELHPLSKCHIFGKTTEEVLRGLLSVKTKSKEPTNNATSS